MTVHAVAPAKTAGMRVTIDNFIRQWRSSKPRDSHEPGS